MSSKDNFLKFLIKNYSVDAKNIISKWLNLIALNIMLAEQILYSHIKNDKQQLNEQRRWFSQAISLISICLGVLFIATIISDRILNIKTSSNQCQTSIIKLITKVLRSFSVFSLKISLIPSLFESLQLFESHTLTNRDIDKVLGIVAVLVIGLTQLIIILVENMHIFSPRNKLVGSHCLINQLLLFQIHFLLFPLLIASKWIFISFQIITTTILIYLMMRKSLVLMHSQNFDRACISFFAAIQLYLVLSKLYTTKQNEINLNVIVLCILLSVLFILIQEKITQTSVGAETNNFFHIEMYFSVLNRNYQKTITLLLKHQQQCQNTKACRCRQILFRINEQKQQICENRKKFSHRFRDECISFIIQDYQKKFSQPSKLSESQLKIQFDNLSYTLLFYCYLLILQKKMYTHSFYLLKSFQQRWKGIRWVFDLQIEIFIEQTIMLKNEQFLRSSQSFQLYKNYWEYHRIYDQFFKLIEENIDIVLEIWSQMLHIQPQCKKILCKMKTFDSLDRKILNLFHSLNEICPQQIPKTNFLMRKYEKVILKVFHQKYSRLKSINMVQQKLILEKNKVQKIISKESRMFSKTLNSSCLLVSLNSENEQKYGQIKHKSRSFKKIFEQNRQITALNNIIIPQIRETHSYHMKKFMVGQTISLDHCDALVMIPMLKQRFFIQKCEILCQIMTLNNDILCVVFINKLNRQKNQGLVLLNNNNKIIYLSKQIHEYLEIVLKPSKSVKSKDTQEIKQNIEVENFFNYIETKIGQLNSLKAQFSKESVDAVYNDKSFEIIKSQSLSNESLKTYHLKFTHQTQNNTINQEIISIDLKQLSEQQSLCKSINTFVEKNVKNEEYQKTIDKLEQFYYNAILDKNTQLKPRVRLYFFLIVILFLSLWIAGNYANIEKITVINKLSTKVSGLSQLINSICEAATASKILVIKSYFDEQFEQYEQGIEIIEYFKQQILKNLQWVPSENIISQIYHLTENGTVFYTKENLINSIMNGLVKQLTFMTEQDPSSFKFHPILSQNNPPLSGTLQNFFQANYNTANTIFINLFFKRMYFFQHDILSQLNRFSSNRALIIALLGLCITLLLCVLSILFRRNDQLVREECLQIFQGINYEQKSLRITQVKEFKECLMKQLKQQIPEKIKPFNLIHKNKNQEISNDSGVTLKDSRLEVTQKPQEQRERFQNILIKPRQKNKTTGKVFAKQPFVKIYLRTLFYFFPFLIYFLHLGIQNVVFDSQVETMLKFLNQLGWQRQFITASRFFSIQLGMYEVDFNLGKNNAATIDQIFQKMHDLKKQTQNIKTDSNFWKVKTMIDNINICENMHFFKQAKTLGAKFTKEECYDHELFWDSLDKGFHQGLVLYLDTIRQYSTEFEYDIAANFNISERQFALTDGDLNTVIILEEYLQQLHEMLYQAYQEDLRNYVSSFQKTNTIAGVLSLIIWIGATVWYSRYIMKRKLFQISIVRAAYKLISYQYLLKSEQYLDRIIKGNTHNFVK